MPTWRASTQALVRLAWLLPIPLGKMWAASEADLTLTDSTDGTVVWHHTVRGEVSRVLMLYTARGMR